MTMAAAVPVAAHRTGPDAPALEQPSNPGAIQVHIGHTKPTFPQVKVWAARDSNPEPMD